MRLTALALALVTWLVLAAPALANDNGEGIVGETDDRIITFASLGVIVFFVLVVITGSALQAFLDKRKQQRKAAELRRRVGW
jgi:nitrogen fixation/metabolism regulation signal transduction histidine kinase